MGLDAGTPQGWRDPLSPGRWKGEREFVYAQGSQRYVGQGL